MSTLCLFVSLLEPYQCFPREDVCLIFVLGSVSRNTVPRGVFPNTLAREQEVYWKILSLKIMSFNIDNVKINTSMMREWPIFKQVPMGSCQKPGFLLYPIPELTDDFQN